MRNYANQVMEDAQIVLLKSINILAQILRHITFNIIRAPPMNGGGALLFLACLSDCPSVHLSVCPSPFVDTLT